MNWWAWLFWSLAALLGVAALFTLYRALLHDRPRGRRRCPRCWYDMAGLDGLKCPECGRQARRERSLRRTRRRWGRALAGLALAALAYASSLAPRAIASGSVWNAVPTPVLVVVLQFYDGQSDQLLQSVTGRMFGAATGLSTWEKLLVARRCAIMLREPDVSTPLVGFPPPSPAPSPASSPASTSAAPSAPVSVVTSSVSISGYFSDSRHEEALNLLTRLGPDARPATSALAAIVDDPASRLRPQAIWALSAIGPGASAAAPALGRALSDAGLRNDALDALSSLGQSAKPAVPALQKLLHSPAPDLLTLIHTAKLLHALLPDSQTLPLFRGLLDSPDHTLRIAGVRGLELLGPAAHAAIPDILRVTRDPPEPLRSTGVSVLASFGAAAVPSLIELVDSPDDDLARSAAYWLISLHKAAAPATDALLRALSRSDPQIRGYAASALGEIGSADALPALRTLSADPDPWVRKLAADAAAQIQETAPR